MSVFLVTSVMESDEFGPEAVKPDNLPSSHFSLRADVELLQP